MNSDLQKKADLLESIIKQYSSVIVAFSGGVDSTFLAFICKKVLGNKTILATATSSTYPQRELSDARAIGSSFDLKHLFVTSEELDIPRFVQNSHDRCYYCKKELFSKLVDLAGVHGCSAVFDGNNIDDIGDYRPGRRAIKELGVISPLELASLTKQDIRELSHLYNLPTAEKPAMACLSSRIPYGEEITKEKLRRIEHAENYLADSGFTQFRVRSHGDLARLEFISSEIEKAFSQRSKIHAALKKAGFSYICIDLQGYRTGAMNEVLNK
ncbi:MAG TPA: ATP-dependent sacrificial sulfur transferase LarE [Chitinispirillaceae bacterium]|nr:ATP-dependent sacrificial sulfur transferase LarE [Chitinispirillaceae bacterium]